MSISFKPYFSSHIEGVNFKEDILKSMDGYHGNTPDGQDEAGISFLKTKCSKKLSQGE